MRMDLDAEIVRFLHEVQFASSTRHGIEVAVAKQGQSNAWLRAVLAASDDEIIEAVLPAYRKQFTLQQIRDVADFYDSDAGRAITQQQVAQVDNVNATLHLTKAQQEATDRFMASEAAKALRRTQQVDFAMERNAYLKAAFQARVDSDGKKHSS